MITIVDLYHSGSLVKDSSNEYEVSEVSIFTWNKKFSPIKMEDESTITVNEIAKLKKQMLRLPEENEI